MAVERRLAKRPQRPAAGTTCKSDLRSTTTATPWRWTLRETSISPGTLKTRSRGRRISAGRTPSCRSSTVRSPKSGRGSSARTTTTAWRPLPSTARAASTSRAARSASSRGTPPSTSAAMPSCGPTTPMAPSNGRLSSGRSSPRSRRPLPRTVPATCTSVGTRRAACRGSRTPEALR